MKSLLKRVARSLGYEIRAILEPPLEPLVGEPRPLDYELLRAFATRAARMSVSIADSGAARHLYLTGILGAAPSLREGRIARGGPHTQNVGIWRREGAGPEAAFVRTSDSRGEWFSWANNSRIGPKRCKWRVAFLGESVARGYLYDPQFNPASALESMLKAELGAAAIDVIDLAKSNLGADQLRTLLGQCLALQPDVIVIFAGNNWRPHLDESDIPCADTVLRADGVPGLRCFLDERTRHAVKLLRRQVTDVLERHGNLPVIWVIPEFNLADWADPIKSAPHLPGQGAVRWRGLYERARLALHTEDLGLAEQLAAAMVELDGGTSAAPLQILAECRRSAKDHREARRYLEMCRDAEGWDPSFSYSPRVSCTIQTALREASFDPRSLVIDLPEVFARQLDDALPDRRVFLDYCHLTAEGIRVAMAEIASGVLKVLSGRSTAARSLWSKCPVPSSKVEGKTSWLAAVHNAHFYQRYEVVHYWCARALEFWPGSAELMRRFVDSEAYRIPLIACKSILELCEGDEMDTLQYLLRGARQRLDPILGDAVVEALRKVGLDIGKGLSDLRLAQYSISTGCKELTDFYFSSAIPNLAECAWTSCSLLNNGGSHSTFTSAYWERSKFVFLAGKGQPVGLELTYRLPASSVPSGMIELHVNGQGVGQACVERTWRTLRLSVLGDCIVDGMNEIVISWPIEALSSEEVLGQTADALVAGQLPRFHTVFGEIHSLKVFEARAGDRCERAVPIERGDLPE